MESWTPILCHAEAFVMESKKQYNFVILKLFLYSYLS